MFYFHPFLGKIPILTNIFQLGWNHQLDNNNLSLSKMCQTQDIGFDQRRWGWGAGKQMGYQQALLECQRYAKQVTNTRWTFTPLTIGADHGYLRVSPSTPPFQEIRLSISWQETSHWIGNTLSDFHEQRFQWGVTQAHLSTVQCRNNPPWVLSVESWRGREG